jgi:hypothetical protein
MSTGRIPSVTICEQLNDLRVDSSANHVITYLFENMDSKTSKVVIEDPQSEIQVIKQQRFEESYKREMRDASLKRKFSEAFPNHEEDFPTERKGI